MSDLNELVARLTNFEANVENRFNSLEVSTGARCGWNTVIFPKTLEGVVNLLRDIQGVDFLTISEC